MTNKMKLFSETKADSSPPTTMSSASPYPQHPESIELAIKVPLPASSSTFFALDTSLNLTADDVEINPTSSPLSEGIASERNQSSLALAPVDKGFGAWTFVCNLAAQWVSYLTFQVSSRPRS